MNKPESVRPPADDRGRDDDANPWDEFLSESSAELQELQRADTTVSRVAPVVSIVQVERDVVEPVPTQPPSEAKSPVLTPLERAVQEPAPRPSARPPISRFALNHALSIRDVLNRQVGVQWAEAVATVEELCLVLGDDETGGVPVPEVADVLLTSAGTVAVRPGSSGDPDVAALGRTLNAMLAASSTPLPLRLFVTSSSTAGRYRSIALYRDALSYYAAPDNRQELIRALYQRAAEAAVVPTPPPVRAVVTAEPKPHVAAVRRALPGWAAAAAIGLVLGSVASAWVLRRTPVPVRVVKEGGAEGAPLPSVPRDDWQLGDVLTSPPERRTAGVPSERPSPSVPLLPASSLSPATVGEPMTAVIPPGGSGGGSSAPVQRPSGPQGPAPTSGRVPPPPEKPAAVPVDTRIYTANDRDVQPPVMLSRAPAPPRSPVELVIDEQGNVQAARFLTRPTGLTDFNELPPLKMLKFQPARKDGRPVSYQYLLPVVGASP